MNETVPYLPQELDELIPWGQPGFWPAEVWAPIDDFLDSRVEILYNLPGAMHWVFGPGLNDESLEIRVLALKIVENGPMTLEGHKIRKLREVAWDNSLPINLRARAAAALWNRGERTDELKAILERAANTKDLTTWVHNIFR